VALDEIRAVDRQRLVRRMGKASSATGRFRRPDRNVRSRADVRALGLRRSRS
jgi:hypothetical protein